MSTVQDTLGANSLPEFSESLRVLELNITLDGMGFSGGNRLSLGGDSLTSLVSFSLQLVVGSDSLQEAFSGGRDTDVVGSDVNSLGDNSLSVLLVDDNTD